MERACPKCNSKDIETERRLDGDSWCGNCGYKSPTEKFNTNGGELIESVSYTPAENKKNFRKQLDSFEANSKA